MPTTGARDISNLLTGTVSGGTATLIRSGSVVTLNLNSITFTGSSPAYGAFLSLPTGFAPPFTISDDYAGPASSRRIAISTGGAVYSDRPAGETLRRSFTYVTRQVWPPSLPGTAA